MVVGLENWIRTVNALTAEIIGLENNTDTNVIIVLAAKQQTDSFVRIVKDKDLL